MKSRDNGEMWAWLELARYAKDLYHEIAVQRTAAFIPGVPREVLRAWQDDLVRGVRHLLEAGERIGRGDHATWAPLARIEQRIRTKEIRRGIDPKALERVALSMRANSLTVRAPLARRTPLRRKKPLQRGKRGPST